MAYKSASRENEELDAAFRAIRALPGSSKAWLDLGSSLRYATYWSTAEAVLRVAEARFPHRFELIDLLGLIYRAKHDFERAEETYMRALAISDGKNENSWDGLVQSLALAGKTKRALEVCSEAKQRFPMNSYFPGREKEIFTGMLRPGDGSDRGVPKTLGAEASAECSRTLARAAFLERGLDPSRADVEEDEFVQGAEGLAYRALERPTRDTLAEVARRLEDRPGDTYLHFVDGASRRMLATSSADFGQHDVAAWLDEPCARYSRLRPMLQPLAAWDRLRNAATVRQHHLADSSQIESALGELKSWLGRPIERLDSYESDSEGIVALWRSSVRSAIARYESDPSGIDELDTASSFFLDEDFARLPICQPD
jgi:tetratricopeptide (TPR) repeat protein